MLNIPPLLLGTFEFQNENELKPIILSSIENNIIGFDTSPSYNTENILGNILECISKMGIKKTEELFIQDKIDGWQMESTKGHIHKFIDISLKRLKRDYIDVVFIHWPFPDYLNETWTSLKQIQDEGKIKYIGLSNVRTRHLKKIIKETNIKPNIIQIERHPLRTCEEEIQYCHTNHINIEAYSPVCRMDSRLTESKILQSISEKYKKNIGQIILRWHIDTGVTPVFMTKKTNRILENSQIFDFALEPQEIEAINSLNANYKIFVESVCCPGI